MGFGKKRNYKKIVLIILGFVLLLSSIGFLAFRLYKGQIVAIENKYKKKIEDLKVKKYMSKKEVYIANEYISRGETLTKENLIKKEIFTDLKTEHFFNKSQIGNKARINLSFGEVLLKSMVFKGEITNDLRIEEINGLMLQTKLKKGEFIDVRINFPNAQEFRVLSKKRLIDFDLKNNTIWLKLNEKERLLLSSAFNDQSSIKGTIIYIDKYIAPNIQKKAILNYLPNKDILTQLNGFNKEYEKVDFENRKNLIEKFKEIDKEVIDSIEQKNQKDKDIRKDKIENIEKDEEDKNDKEKDQKKEEYEFD